MRGGQKTILAVLQGPVMMIWLLRVAGCQGLTGGLIFPLLPSRLFVAG